MDLSFEREVTKAHMRAANWDVEVSGEVSIFESYVFYLCDLRYHRADVITARERDFNGFDPSTAFNPPEYASIETLNRIIVQHASTFWAQGFSPAETNSFILIIMALCKESAAYREWRSEAKHGQRLHCMITIHEEIDNFEDGVLCQTSVTAIHSDATVIDRDWIIEKAESLASQDDKAARFEQFMQELRDEDAEEEEEYYDDEDEDDEDEWFEYDEE